MWQWQAKCCRRLLGGQACPALQGQVLRIFLSSFERSVVGHCFSDEEFLFFNDRVGSSLILQISKARSCCLIKGLHIWPCAAQADTMRVACSRVCRPLHSNNITNTEQVFGMMQILMPGSYLSQKPVAVLLFSFLIACVVKQAMPCYALSGASGSAAAWGNALHAVSAENAPGGACHLIT